jgi:tetratricopeptide (TPR) repeat protein
MEQGDALRASGQYEDAVALYDRIVREFSTVEEQSCESAVRVALAKKGSALLRLDRFSEADAAFDALCARTASAKDTQDAGLALERARRLIAEHVSWRMRALDAEGNHAQVLVAAEALLKRFSSTPPPKGKGSYVVLGALGYKAEALGQLGKAREAIAVYDELVNAYGDKPDDPDLDSKVADALLAKAQLLDEQDLPADVIETVDKLLERSGDASSFELRLHISRALMKKAVALGLLGHWESALAVEDDLVRRNASESDPQLREDAARALSLKALALRKLGRVEQSIDAWGELAELPDDSAAMLKLSAYGLLQRAELLSVLGRFSEAIVLCDALIGMSDEASGQQLPLEALVVKANALLSEERYNESVAVLNDYLCRADEAPGLRTDVATALCGKAHALRQLDRDDEARVVLTTVIERFQDDASSKPAVSAAREELKELLDTHLD